jgi:hypothetical protein
MMLNVNRSMRRSDAAEIWQMPSSLPVREPPDDSSLGIQ